MHKLTHTFTNMHNTRFHILVLYWDSLINLNFYIHLYKYTFSLKTIVQNELQTCQNMFETNKWTCQNLDKILVNLIKSLL